MTAHYPVRKVNTTLNQARIIKKKVFCASISEDKTEDELEKQHHFSDSCVLPCKGGESLTKASTQCCAVCWADREGISVFKQGVTNS